MYCTYVLASGAPCGKHKRALPHVTLGMDHGNPSDDDHPYTEAELPPGHCYECRRPFVRWDCSDSRYGPLYSCQTPDCSARTSMLNAASAGYPDAAPQPDRCAACGDPLEPYEALGLRDGEPTYTPSAICINEQCPGRGKVST